MDFFSMFTSPFLALVFFLAYTWIEKVNKETGADAAHINLLQIEKVDRDGEVEMTGTLQLKKGADIPSAVNLVPGSDGNYFDVTGVTSITSIQKVLSQPGTIIGLHFDGVLTLIHHATNLILPGGANITTAAGDEAFFVNYDTDKWRCFLYTKASGKAVVDVVGLLNIVEDTTPQLGGTLDCQNKDIDNIKTATFNSEYDAGNSGGGAKTIDFNNGQNQKVVLNGDPTFAFTAPPGPAHCQLRMIQDGTGGRDPSWPGANFTWTDDTEPTWATGANEVSVVNLWWDGADWWAAGMKFA